jgi:hypothetical protein
VNYDATKRIRLVVDDHSKEDKSERFGGEIKASDKIDAGDVDHMGNFVTNHDARDDCPETPKAWSKLLFDPSYYWYTALLVLLGDTLLTQLIIRFVRCQTPLALLAVTRTRK